MNHTNIPPGTAKGNKGRKGLIAALIAVCVALAAVVTLIILLLTGVIGGDGTDGQTLASWDGGTVTGTDTTTALTDDTGGEVPEADAPEPLSLVMERRQTVCTDATFGRERELLRFSVEDLTIGDGSAGIQAFAKDFNGTQDEFIRNSVLSNAQMAYSASTENPQIWYGVWYEDRTLLFDRADTQVLSFATLHESYMGGTHGGVWYTPCNIDAETGEAIAFADIVKDHRALAEAMFAEMKKIGDLKQVCDYYENDSDVSFPEYIQMYTLTGTDGGELNWTLSPQGFHVWFGDYDLGAYAMGRGDVIIPFDAYPEVFHESAYITQKNVPAVTDAQLTYREDAPSRMALSAYCDAENPGFIPVAFCEWNGIYVSGDSRLVISPYGTYEFHQNGTLVSEGDICGTGSGLLLFEGLFTPDTDKEPVGSVRMRRDEGEDVVELRWGEEHTGLYTCDAEASAEAGFIRRPVGPIAVTEEQMESLWTNGYSIERGVELHAWRGEFETKDAYGKPVIGDIIYNGDPNSPVYTMRATDGTDYAVFVFLDGSVIDEDADPVMYIIYLQEGERGEVLYRAKG